jgi:hypothetical protein
MTRAMVRAGIKPTEKTAPELTESSSRTLELTKALRVNYEAVTDLTVHFRKFAVHTSPGSPDDLQQAESLRAEASVLAAMVKQTVPTVMFNWLCKILHDEHLMNLQEESKNREKIRRYYGPGSTAQHIIDQRENTHSPITEDSEVIDE